MTMFQLILLFLGVFTIIMVTLLVILRSSKAEKATLNRAQSIVDGGEGEQAATSTTSPLLMSADRVDNKNAKLGLKGSSLAKHIDLLIQQSAMTTTVYTIFGLSALGAVIGFMAAWMFIPMLPLECLALSIGGLIPYLFLRFKRARRLTSFDKFLPDAMDLVSRAVKSGHAVQTAFNLAGTQAQQPVRNEFAVMNGQVRFGLSFREALLQMSERIPTQDLRFLVTAVLIQRETGGNLPQVLDRTTHMIRERIRILGEMKVKTAQGRMSGAVLVLMPIGLAIAMRIITPTWLDPLMNDPIGHYLLYYAAISLLIGGCLVYLITRSKV